MSAVWASLYLSVGWVFAELFLKTSITDSDIVRVMGTTYLLFLWPLFVASLLVQMMTKD